MYGLSVPRDDQLGIGQPPAVDISLGKEGCDSRQSLVIESQCSGVCQLEHSCLLSAHTYASVLYE